MSNIIDQGLISQHSQPVWKKLFSEREYDYLTHVVNGLLQHGEFSELSIQYGEKNGLRALHIFEPFSILNCMGYGSPSVVSIAFDENEKIQFLTGGNNGLGIFSKDVTLERSRKFPRNNTAEVDFWHFVDAIGDANHY